jgi:hypothetical protein
LHLCFDTQTANLGAEFGDVERALVWRRQTDRLGRNGFAEGGVAKSLSGWTYPFEPAGVQ